MLTRSPRTSTSRWSPTTISAENTSAVEPEYGVATSEYSAIQVVIHSRLSLAKQITQLAEFVLASAPIVPLSRHPAWLNVLQLALGHEPYAVQATSGGRIVGFLPLALLDTLLFGRFLVSLPYLNSSGVSTTIPQVQTALIERAVTLADELNVRYLELRHEQALDHPALTATFSAKVHMRLALPQTPEQLWKGFDPKVRNQIRKAEKQNFVVQWGAVEQLEPFHEVLSRNMRDLGSPVYGVELFRGILATFPGQAEICVVWAGKTPVATALLLHGWGVTEVPTASSLKELNSTSVNMLMYYHLLCRAVERNQRVFDFGRSTLGGNTYRFKKQWGAQPLPALWQYHLNDGQVGEMRPESPRYERAIRIWKQLPVWLTRRLGPQIVRGIP
jgi:FemAB-related protein (PEP-CTERM system-associated)